MDWFVYIVECSEGSYYTGITRDVEKRVTQHNGGAGGAKFTRVRRPVVLVFVEKTDTRSTALKREYEIKQLTREKKQELVKNYMGR